MSLAASRPIGHVKLAVIRHSVRIISSKNVPTQTFTSLKHPLLKANDKRKHYLNLRAKRHFNPIVFITQTQ